MHYAGPYLHRDRQYVDYAGADYESVGMDKYGRQYYYCDPEEVYDVYACYYVAGYSFHQPVRFRAKSIKPNWIQLGEDPFIAHQRTVTNIGQSRMILEAYLATK